MSSPFKMNPGRGSFPKTGRGISKALKGPLMQESNELNLTPEMQAYLKSPRGQEASRINNSTIRPTSKIYETPENNSDSFSQQVGTLLSNPADGIVALANQATGNTRKLFGLSDQGDLDGVRGSLTNLRRGKLSGDKGVEKELRRSSGLNFASQVGMLGSGTALGAQTVNDLIQGDATGAIIKKAKVLKPIYNAVKKLGVDPTKLTKQAYKAYKTNKNVF